ncbi:hypothetical protein DH2020_044313 [Rehmannia glutinosa]|uniref:Uncharacterized protein n=1 Tax=Rehmannia glutinosa TaxID=99300 RepID=A0ABR0UH80_REHGL
MDAEIDANAPLDYIEFHIFPSQNRYEACACYVNKIEKVTSGLLEHLLVHSAEVKALHSKGSNANYKLKPPENHDIKWFTKFILTRFLHIIGSANILDITNSVKNEISQLEEARRFHLSLHAKGTDYQHRTGDSGRRPRCFQVSLVSHLLLDFQNSIFYNLTVAYRNELLKAIDLRLTALRGELVAAFDQAAGSTSSVEEMTDIEKFSHHFGSIELRDSLRKYLELRRGNPAVDRSSSKPFLESDQVSGKKQGYNHTPILLPSETPVKYGVSPAKAAQVERQSSTESDGSSSSSEEERPFTDRSRTLIRSASPRRSASPMRRVQIGRSGSRRSTAITIKNLNYFPTRERSVLPNDSDEEGPEQAPRKSETNVRRMSVQDAINLFESKQKDQPVDVQKARSLLNASMAANKSVMRRWSSGMGEDSSQCPQDLVSEDAVPQIQNDLESREIENSSQEAEDYHTESCGLDVKLNFPEKEACSTVVTLEETPQTESNNASEKLTASVEWSRQKEGELNELLSKMMETKPAKNRTAVNDSRKRQSLPTEQRGGFNNHYNEKRDKKIRGETLRKNAEKDKKFRPAQQIPDKSEKNVSRPANPKTENNPKLGTIKNATPKASSLPATRKSWPSMPSPRTSEKSTAKTPVSKSSTNTNPPCRKSQPAPFVSRPSPKVETSQPRAKSVKSNQNNSTSSLGTATERKQQSVTRPSKTVKSKVQTAPKDLSSSAKPSLYSKVTKKGSIVPLEPKPFLRKGSKIISNTNPVMKVKTSSNPQEPLRISEDAEENEAVSNSSDPVVQPQERAIEELETRMGIESGTPIESPQKCEDEGFSQVDPTIGHDVDRLAEPDLKAEAEEESTISPTAWVEIEEHEDQPVTSPAHIAPVGLSSTRVRHSLSQMLLEESSEQDIIWGNAENPSTVVYQKDAPKGLKRLLKFARKSKTDANAAGWSSPSIFSEGEDDTEDSKFATRRSSENLLKKATLHSKNNGDQRTTYRTYQKNLIDYEQPAEPNISKFSTQSLFQHLREGQVSASVTTTKAGRAVDEAFLAHKMLIQAGIVLFGNYILVLARLRLQFRS